MSDSDDDWTEFLGEQTDSEDDQPFRARHIMQDRKRKISSSNQPRISKKSKTDFEDNLEPDWRQNSKNIEGIKVPLYIWDRMKKHQKAGLKWLWNQVLGNSGGILGDEMGLGKTLQIISLCVGMHYAKKTDPIMIIVPCTLQRQWVQEFDLWWPLLNIQTLETEKDCRRIRDNTVYIVGYERVRINAEALININWGLVVCDEGHRLRNMNCQTTRIIKRINCDCRFILTGSPIMNNLSELWSLIDFVQPGLLGKHAVFNEQLALPIAQGSQAKSSHLQIATALRCAEEVRTLIKPILLRRLKSQVDLVTTEKQEHVLFIKMTKKQDKIYQKFLNSEAVKRVITGDAVCFTVLQVMA